jgi:hypothetical protein
MHLLAINLPGEGVLCATRCWAPVGRYVQSLRSFRANPEASAPNPRYRVANFVIDRYLVAPDPAKVLLSPDTSVWGLPASVAASVTVRHVRI